MALTETDYEHLREQIAAAVESENVKIDDLRREVRQIKVHKLDRRDCHAVASLAADGGDNAVMFGPLSLEVIRVVDTHGSVDAVHEVIAMTDDDQPLRDLAARLPVAQRFMERLGVGFDELCYSFGADRYASGGRGSDVSARLRAFRDLLEWAMLLDLARKPWPVSVLLMRDGLLRSKTIRRETFTKLAAAFQRACEKPAGAGQVHLVGVAKTSAVLSKLGVAMALEGTFDRKEACYARMPPTLEARCYNHDWKWMNAQAAEQGESTECFGHLHLAKLATSADAPVLPVDVAWWAGDAAARETLEYLANDAAQSFPVIGYPAALRRAHERAVLTGLEMVVTGDLMTDALKASMTSEPQRERVTRMVHLGRELIQKGRAGGS